MPREGKIITLHADGYAMRARVTSLRDGMASLRITRAAGSYRVGERVRVPIEHLLTS